MDWLQEPGLQGCFEHLAYYVYAVILTPALMVIR